MSLRWTAATRAGNRIEGIGIGEGATQLYIDAELWGQTIARAWAGLDDIAYLQVGGGQPERLGETGGTYNVLVTDDDAYWIERAVTHYRSYRTGQRLPIPGGGTSQGFAYFDYLERRIVFTDEVFRTHPQKPRLYRHRSWECWLDPSADRVLAGRIGGQSQAVVDCYTPTGAKIKELADGSALVAISLPSEPGSHRQFPENETPYFRAINAPPVPGVITAGPASVVLTPSSGDPVAVTIPASTVPGQSIKVPVIVAGVLVLVYLVSERQS
jgi:hypothetical protein